MGGERERKDQYQHHDRKKNVASRIELNGSLHGRGYVIRRIPQASADATDQAKSAREPYARRTALSRGALAVITRPTSRERRTLSRLPHSRGLHQQQLRFRVASTKSQPHSGAARCRTPTALRAAVPRSQQRLRGSTTCSIILARSSVKGQPPCASTTSVRGSTTRRSGSRATTNRSRVRGGAARCRATAVERGHSDVWRSDDGGVNGQARDRQAGHATSVLSRGREAFFDSRRPVQT